jgi:hypothetical protein
VRLPTPEPGLVIRYSYLWLREHREGREEGVKDRPCAIVLAARDSDDHTHVLVVPVTHTPPANLAEALELPAAIKQHLGLDTERSWIVLNESNLFEWPGPDLRRVADSQGQRPPAYHTVYNALQAIPDNLNTLALDEHKAYHETYDLLYRCESEGSESGLASRSHTT